jgi:hypothetical protein
MDKLEEFHYFTTAIYAVKKPEFLESIRAVTTKYLEKSKCNHKGKNPMTVMTGDYSSDPEIMDFTQYVSQTAWNILDSQGYNMDHYVTYFTEMWTQEHNFHSNMEQHMHGGGTQMSAFYFVDVPENSNKAVIYDPRPAKVISSLPSKDGSMVNPSSSQVVFTPEEGSLIFLPPWLPHSFTRNFNKDKPMRFVHMNLSVGPAPEPLPDPNVEIV